MEETLQIVESAARAIGRLELERWGPWVVGLLKMLDEQARERGKEAAFSETCLKYVLSSVQIRRDTGGWG